MLSTTFYPALPYASLILVDAMLGPYTSASDAVRGVLVGGAEKKEDTWGSVKEAREGMLKRGVWRAWEARAFNTFIVSVVLSLGVGA